MEAEKCFRQAFLLAKKTNGTLNLGAANLIRILHQQKKTQEIVNLISELGTDNVTKLPEICILMAAESSFLVGHNETSALLYHFLYSKYPQEKGVVLGLSQVLVQIGQLEDSKGVLNSYLQKHALDAEIISNLAFIALESNHLNEAEAYYRKARDLAPRQFITHFNLGRFLQNYGNISEAITEFETCLMLVPKAVEAIMAKAECLAMVGRSKEAKELYRRILSESYLNKEQSIGVAKPLIAAAVEDENFGEVKLYLDHLTAEARSDFRIKSLIYDLPRDLQDTYGEGSHLYSPNALVGIKTLIEDASLLCRISSYILASNSLVKDRAGKPTRGGSQTHEIMSSQDEEIIQLKDLLQRELISYANNLPDEIRPRNDARYRMSGWGVSLESGGYQIRHTHPEARVSGVLYLSIPEDMDVESKNLGGLSFSNWQKKDDRSALQIAAIAGRFVMFPSYLPHETIPFESKQKRICLAVNLIQIYP